MNAVLFDFEGTIVDFQWNLSEAIGEARKKLLLLGINAKQKNYALLYNETLKIAEKIGNFPLVKNVLDEIFDRYDMDALKRWKLRDGVLPVLNLLDERRIKAALVTNVGRRAIDLALKKFDLSFDVVVTRDDVNFLKPSPVGLKMAMKALQTEDVIFIGDSVSDVIAAKRAGIPVVVVSGGESDVEEIKEAEVDYILSNLSEILEILEE
jgi:HAD superfamily hydrolase (TIGR01549 family)